MIDMSYHALYLGRLVLTPHALAIQEINSAAEVIYESVDPDANIIFGAMIDENIVNGEVNR